MGPEGDGTATALGAFVVGSAVLSVGRARGLGAGAGFVSGRASDGACAGVPAPDCGGTGVWGDVATVASVACVTGALAAMTGVTLGLAGSVGFRDVGGTGRGLGSAGVVPGGRAPAASLCDWLSCDAGSGRGGRGASGPVGVGTAAIVSSDRLEDAPALTSSVVV